MAPWLIESIEKEPKKVFHKEAALNIFMATHRSDEFATSQEITEEEARKYNDKIAANESRRRDEQQRLREGYTR